jgi:hypothetical protein
MKDQYIGDIGDYGKYGLLRFLSGRGISIGVNWYLTPPDGRTDGSHTEYLRDERMRVYDDKLFDDMAKIALREDKQIQMIEQSGILNGFRFYSERMDFYSLPRSERNAARSAWHHNALKQLKDTELILADPDNGLSSTKKASAKDAQKFVLPHEIADYYDRGQQIVYYHHRPRKNEEGWTRDKTQILACLPDARLLAVSFNRWSCRTYIFVLHESMYASYCNTLNRFLETAWGTVKVGGKPAFIREPI